MFLRMQFLRTVDAVGVVLRCVCAGAWLCWCTACREPYMLAVDHTCHDHNMFELHLRVFDWCVACADTACVLCAALQVRINYANPDMVGHTGDLKACMQACATVDKCLAELLAVCDEVGGRFMVTSDHGNSDDMVQREKKTNKPLMDVDSGAHDCAVSRLSCCASCLQRAFHFLELERGWAAYAAGAG